MRSDPLRTLVSVASVLLLCVLAYLYSSIPARAKPAEEIVAGSEVVGSFHAHDRQETDIGGAVPPHKENKKIRAFLNLHVKALDCSACHLLAPGARVEKLKDGKLALVRSSGAAEPLAEKDPGVTRSASGKRCAECHSRGNPLLTANYSGAKLRVLEDLSVLRYLESN
jgi:hypothetical protein